MLNMSTINEMAGLSLSEQLEIREHMDHLQARKAFFFTELNVWLTKHGLQTVIEDSLFRDDFYQALVSGEYGDNFYVTLYHQALDLQRKGLRQSQVMLVLSQCRKLFVSVSEEIVNMILARALCHAVDLGQSIVSGVYRLQEQMQHLQQKSDAEIKRMRRLFHLVAVAEPEKLIQAYMDHQDWKFWAYSLALGGVSEKELPHSISDCCLGHWVDLGGLDRLPVAEKQAFQKAHERVHQLCHAALNFANHNHPERIIVLLTDMELASDEVCSVILDLIEEEFVRLSTLDALTGLPSRRAFDLQLTSNLAFAERHDLWMGIILVDIDHFKDFNDEHGHVFGDAVLVEVAQVLQGVLRTEDDTYRWGGEEFAILVLDKHQEGIQMLAERARQSVESYLFCADSSSPKSVTVSCGSICVHPRLRLGESEVFEAVDTELYKAKETGRNQVSHRTLQAD